VQRPRFPFLGIFLPLRDNPRVAISPSEPNYFDIKIKSLTFVLLARKMARSGDGCLEIVLALASLQAVN
jgi:hypothetical protein